MRVHCKSVTGLRALTTLGCVFLTFIVAACSGPFPQSTFEPRSDFSGELLDLYGTIFWLAVAVFVVVESLLVYAVIRFRARPGQTEQPKQIQGHTALEIVWTLAPAAILVFIAVPTVETIFRRSAAAPSDALTVEVIGHQWWWEYRYPDYNIVTANELHVPVGRPVSLELTSRDVIHSFWAPRLFGKRDAILGRTNRLLFTPDSVGAYRGQCAEFCGESHANMGLRVMVDSQTDFDAWVAEQQAVPPPVDSLSPLVLAGLNAFKQIREPATNSCIACHRIDGVSGGVLGPNLTHLAGRTTIAAGMLPNTAEGLAQWLRNSPAVKPGSLMPNIGLTEEEINALVAYLQTLR